MSAKKSTVAYSNPLFDAFWLMTDQERETQDIALGHSIAFAKELYRHGVSSVTRVGSKGHSVYLQIPVAELKHIGVEYTEGTIWFWNPQKDSMDGLAHIIKPHWSDAMNSLYNIFRDNRHYARANGELFAPQELIGLLEKKE
jgi:hypothetical protein